MDCEVILGMTVIRETREGISQEPEAQGFSEYKVSIMVWIWSPPPPKAPCANRQDSWEPAGPLGLI